ncbi:hypothetical protein [Loigolactobacillus bifermentans]|uniref:hypothetical protein n=1 Tax=Loigolactobacillus bifermentans TaxID=1607 RepID=UPI000708D2C9|nr:hypothetical protein [Loigolactobacillus bifermentans]QGG59675.1 hypothetical protein LB003_03800 [Loigolactobacillus bifermentans]
MTLAIDGVKLARQLLTEQEAITSDHKSMSANREYIRQGKAEAYTHIINLILSESKPLKGGETDEDTTTN